MAKAKSAEKPKTTTRNGEGAFEPFAIDAVQWQKAGTGTFKRLGRYGGGCQVGVGIDILKPGQYSNRFHYHLKEEEHVFILRGSATLHLGSEKYVMNERDYCCFPAGQRVGHRLYNHTEENCLFMTIGDNRLDDIAVFPHTGKARIRATGKMVSLSEI